MLVSKSLLRVAMHWGDFEVKLKLWKETELIFPKAHSLLKPTGYVMHQQFNIQQLYVLPTLYLCVLHLSENKERPVPLTA